MPTTYRDLHALDELFAQASKNPAICETLAQLLDAAPARAHAWPPFLQAQWKDHAAKYFESLPKTASLGRPQQRLLQAMLNMGLDDDENHKLRPLYIRLFHALHPQCPNAEGILQVTGLTLDNPAPVLAAAARLQVFHALRAGIRLWIPGMGVNTLQELDEKHCSITLEEDPEKHLPLADLLARCVVILPVGTLESLVLKKKVAFAGLPELYQAACDSIITCQDPSPSLVDKILIPAFYGATELRAMCSPQKQESQASEKNQAAQAGRWDYSRSLVEMLGRLEKAAITEGAPWNRENLKTLLAREAGRADMAVRCASALALLFKNDLTRDLIQDLCQELQGQFLPWHELALFVKVSDALPGKYVSEWFNLSRELVGADYLIEATLQMPCHLWAYTEKTLKSSEEHKTFEERFFKDFKEGRATSDHFMWLWKKVKHSDERAAILSNSTLLFKILHQDVKGNYLKSQRNLRKALLDSEEFLYEVVQLPTDLVGKGTAKKRIPKAGSRPDLNAIRALVRCAKRMPLLDTREKQSLLVKIARLGDEAKAIVEENVTTQVKQTIDRLTSQRSFRQLQAELEKLLNEEIPANTAAIEDARSRGDLSENSEYKYAKEVQRNLARRRNTLQQELSVCQPMDFSTQEVGEYVIPGSVITLREGDGTLQQVTLLGLYDGDSQKNWYSYDSPMGRILLGNKAEAKVTLPSGKAVVIQAISPLPQDVLDFLR
ncbi:MAG: GreA/GreB family elongation factor [Oligosphaeraceae bacterium]